MGSMFVVTVPVRETEMKFRKRINLGLQNPTESLNGPKDFQSAVGLQSDINLESIFLYKHLEDCLKKHEVIGAFWGQSIDEEFTQVTFTVSSEKAEKIMNKLMTEGIGRKYNSSLCVCSASVYQTKFEEFNPPSSMQVIVSNTEVPYSEVDFRLPRTDFINQHTYPVESEASTFALHVHRNGAESHIHILDKDGNKPVGPNTVFPQIGCSSEPQRSEDPNNSSILELLGSIQQRFDTLQAQIQQESRDNPSRNLQSNTQPSGSNSEDPNSSILQFLSSIQRRLDNFQI